MNKHLIFLILACLLSAIALNCAAQEQGDANTIIEERNTPDIPITQTPPETEPENVAPIPIDEPDEPADPPPLIPASGDLKIVIWKSERRLELHSGDAIIRNYPIGLGFSPVGDKFAQGDGRTPEGEFYVCVKNPNSRYHLSLGVSYPSTDDAERGLAEGLIDNRQYERIRDAIAAGRKPPWDTPLGGEICIHGYGASSDWTLGCIALDNPDIEELYANISNGTVVVINP